MAIKNSLMKKPAAFALNMKSILSLAENTVSNTKERLSRRQPSLRFSQCCAALRTDSVESQSPNFSWAIISGLIYKIPYRPLMVKELSGYCSLAGTVRTSYYYQLRRLIRRFHSVHFLYAVQLLNVLWHTVAHIVHHILFEPP